MDFLVGMPRFFSSFSAAAPFFLNSNLQRLILPIGGRAPCVLRRCLEGAFRGAVRRLVFGVTFPPSRLATAVA